MREIKEKLGVDIDVEKFQNKVSKTKYYRMVNERNVNGLAVFSRNAIKLKDVGREDSAQGKEIRRHEGIHIKTGMQIMRYNGTMSEGLLEGETENLNQDSFGNTGSFSSNRLDEENKMRQQIFNFSHHTSYPENVCLIKQMEVALGKKSYDSVLKGDMSFERDFIKQYGLISFIKIAAATDLLKNIGIGANDNQLFRMNLLAKAQNDLLKAVFNKDFSRVQTPQDAVELLRKLRSFDLVRMRDFKANDNKQLVEDPTYQNYYLEMHSKIKQKLMSLGYLEAQINQHLEGLEYKKQRFNPNVQEKNSEEKARSCANLCLWMQGIDKSINPDGCTFLKVANLDGQTKNYMVRNGKLLSVNAVPIPGEDAFRLVVEEKDLETEMKDFAQQGFAISKFDVEPQAVKEKMNEITAERLKNRQEMEQRKAAEQQKKAEEKEQQEQGMTPYKRNIFQKLFDRIKETFNRRKDEKESEQPQSQNAFAKADQKTEEERRPSWDLRNWGMTRESLQQQPRQPQTRNVENQRSVGSRPMNDGPEK